MSAEGSLAITEVARDVVQVSGPDAMSFLQGQLSQDLAALEIGDSAFSLLLQPQGKVDAYLRLTRAGEDQYLIDVDSGWAQVVVDRLERFKLRVKCSIEVLDNWLSIALRGLPSIDLGEWSRTQHIWVVIPELSQGEGVDLLGRRDDLTAALDALADSEGSGHGLTALDPSDYEAMRIESGVPRMGAELTTSTIPGEAGIVERAVSFTKGCYTGQELVARVDSRGNKVPRLLRLVVIEGDAGDGASEIRPGCRVLVGGAEAGRLTSAAWSRHRAAIVALAYVRREIEVPCEANVESVGAPAKLWTARLDCFDS